MLRFFRHNLTMVDVASGSDEVVASMPMPSECVQNNVWGECQLLSESDILISAAMLYGMDGYVLNLPDPDTQDSIDDLWDRLVDKDEAVASGAIDLDTTTEDTTPHYEAGEPSLGAIMDEHTYNDDNHWFSRRGMMSFASSPTGFNWVTGTLSTYNPRDVFKIRSRKSIFTELHSMSLLGLSVPNIVTTGTVPSSPPAGTFIQEKYLEVILEQAWMHITGIIEAGAETPWEEASAGVQELLEPAVYEDTIGAFTNAGDLQAFTKCTFDISVPGRREFKILSGE